MLEEIKQRIETIKAGKVPDGYKKTVVGIVPNEWEVKRLSELLEFQNGINADKEKYKSGTKMISVVDILSGKPIFYDDIIGQVDIDEETFKKYSVTYGDILFQRSSETFEDAGKSNVYLDKENTATYSGFVIRGKKISDYEPYYLNEILKTPGARQQIMKYAAGAQHINVSQDSLSRVSVCLANEYEQKCTAKILLKWDKAIDLQEKLIEKLELQKKALMQRLLTPKDNWEKVKLGDICSISTGKLDVNAMVENGRYPFFTCSKQIYQIDNYAFDCEALLVAGNGDIGDIKYYCGKFNAYQSTYVLDSFTFPIKYVLYYLENNFQKTICLETQKSSMPYIKLSTLANSKIYYNPSIINSVVNIFEKINNNLYFHKSKLEKLIKQHKAMQQLLLTGIVRV